MKIGIFGDSFAIGSNVTQSTHWYNVLGNILNAEVKTHGLGGTALFYSYQKIFKHYKEYDLNIFLVTHFERYTKPFTFSFRSYEPQWASSINHVQNLRQSYRNQITPSEKDYLIRLENWFIVSDDEFMKASHDALVRHIRAEIPNVIFVPCFHENFSMGDKLKEELNIGSRSSCWDFLTAQRKFFGITDNTQGDFYERQDVMSCHFTPETNKIYAEQMAEFINTGKQLSAPDIIDHKHKRDYYYYTS